MSKNMVRATTFVMALLVAGAYWYMNAESAPAQKFVFADASDPKLVRVGKGLYANNCASCHGANLEGQPNWREPLADGTLPAPPHDETGHTWHHPDMMLFGTTKFGGQAFAPDGFKSAMPSFGEQLSDEDILATLAYIKSRWPDEVQQRQNAGNEKLKLQMESTQ